jgi:large subunit ribosomal protein L3
VYDADGCMASVTVLQVGPCTVSQIKTQETDGYEAVQMGYDDKKESRVI